MSPQIFQMCFVGSFSNKWRCQVTQKKKNGGTDQVTATEASILATHWTIENTRIFLMFLTETTMMAHHRGTKMFLAESRERSSRDGMADGSLIDYESHKIQKTVLSATVAGLYFFMKCFGAFQFLQGLWMDLSGEVASIHLKTDAKNLVTAARPIQLPDQKETIYMIFCCERKPVQEVFMILLTFQTTIACQIASQKLQPK